MPKTLRSSLCAILFTDVVGSTALARELGDERWSKLLAAQRRIVREELKAAGGREVDTAGDGFFAVFDRPADAVRCAFIASRRVQEIGLDIRAGVHFGEVDTAGRQVHGVVVHTGARVMGQARAAEVVITQTVKDLVAGARFGVAERDVVELKGVPGMWALYDVLSVDDELRPAPIGGATVAAERRMRTSSVPPRRPVRRWLVRTAIVAALVVVAAILVAVRPRPTYVPASGQVARITADGRAERPIDAASFPTGLAAGDGRIWVTDQRGQIYWIDLASGDVGSRGTAGTPTGAAVGDGAIWITNGFGTGSASLGSVSRLDEQSGQLAPAFATAVGSEAITWGAGAVWVADHDTGTVTRYDPVQLEQKSFGLPSSDTNPIEPDAIVFSDIGPGSLWVGDANRGRIVRLDAGQPQKARTLTIGGSPSAIAVGQDAIFAVSEMADFLYVLDPGSGDPRTSIDVGALGCNAPSSVAVGSGGLWIACSLSQEVVRIDPSISSVTATLAVDGAAAALITDEDGLVWVAVRPR